MKKGIEKRSGVNYLVGGLAASVGFSGTVGLISLAMSANMPRKFLPTFLFLVPGVGFFGLSGLSLIQSEYREKMSKYIDDRPLTFLGIFSIKLWKESFSAGEKYNLRHYLEFLVFTLGALLFCFIAFILFLVTILSS